MRTIELTQEQKNNVLHELSDVNGCFDIYIELDEHLTIHAHGILDIEGYRETDYLNGTGAFAETGRIADVSLEAFVYDEANEEACEVSSDFEKVCYDFIQAA